VVLGAFPPWANVTRVSAVPQGKHPFEVVLAVALTHGSPADCLPVMVGMPCSAPARREFIHMLRMTPNP
jgi:hypothetical protein